VQDDVREALEELLAVEREANATVERARSEARSLRSEGIEAANAARERVVQEARRRADEIIAAARFQAERERDQRLSENDMEISELERSARRRMDAAVRFVVDRLAGKEAVAASGAGAPEEKRAA